MKGWLAVFGCLLVFGCAAVPRDVSPDLAINRWVGHPIQDLINSWGPAGEQKLVDEHQLYVYPATRYGKRYSPANLDPAYPATAFGDLEDLTCKAVFEVDASGVVTAAQWQGRECWEQP